MMMVLVAVVTVVVVRMMVVCGNRMRVRDNTNIAVWHLYHPVVESYHIFICTKTIGIRYCY